MRQANGGADHGAGTGASAPELERVLAHAEDGEWEEAAVLLAGLLEERPDDPLILCWLGTAEHELGLESSAYERFKRCVALGPLDPLVLVPAGVALARFDDPDAEPALRTAALQAPNHPPARTAYGAYLAREGLLDAALVELDAAVALDPDDPEARLERGVAHALAGRLDRAVDDFEGSGRLEPDGWTAVLSGLALHELGRSDEAALELVRGARERPQDVPAQLLASLASAEQGDADTAWEMLERARVATVDQDDPVLLEVEERIDAGADAAAAFLRDTLVPSALHERLMIRP